MSKLFSPYTLGKLQLPNRIVIPPMCQYSAAKLGAQVKAPSQFWSTPPCGPALFSIANP